MNQPDRNASVQHRSKTEVNASLEAKLLRYTTAAGAACAGILGGTPSASAEIVYTPVHVTLAARHRYVMDLNHDGIPDFTLSNGVFSSTDIHGHTLKALAGGNNQVAGIKGVVNTLYASALNRGAEIGPKLTFSGKLMAASGTEYGSVGKWRNVSARYLGLKFFINGQVHYGWARLSVIVGGNTITAALTGYAYETIANRPITAGRQSGTWADADANAANLTQERATEPSMLGFLAAGAIALPLCRQLPESNS